MNCPEERASRNSIEYRIEELNKGEYEVVKFDSFLKGVIKINDEVVRRHGKK